MAEESGRYVVINVRSSVSSLELKLKNACLAMQPSYSIFKTPSILFRQRPSSFCPNCFSIGPMHIGNESLEPADKIKFKYLNDLLSRVVKSRTPETTASEESKEQKILSDLVKEVKSIEKEASSCYAGYDFAAKLGDEFVDRMVLDGVFIVELFRKDAKEVAREEDDPIFSMSCMLQFLYHDLILLENQIPWLVLETLFDKTKLPSETKPLIELALRFFATIFKSYSPDDIKTCLFTGQDIKHILDLLRLSMVLTSAELKNPKTTDSWVPIPSATKLKEAGVEFKKVEPQSILDIKFKFKDGILEIPSLLVQESTETIFRNLIAYEQCLPNCPPIFTCYAKVLDNLIDNPSDMEVLCKTEIMDNWLSPEDSAQFFQKLYYGTFVKEFYYSDLCDDLDRYCRRLLPRWRAAYLQNYFMKPWAIAAQIYALIILGLTVWQAYNA